MYVEEVSLKRFRASSLYRMSKGMVEWMPSPRRKITFAAGRPEVFSNH